MLMSYILGLISALTAPLVLLNVAFPETIPFFNKIIEIFGGTGDLTYNDALEFINYFKDALPMFKDTFSELIAIIFDKII